MVIDFMMILIVHFQQTQEEDARNKGILADLLDLMPSNEALNLLNFINQMEDEVQRGVSAHTKDFFVLLKEFLHASYDNHQK